MTWPRRNIIAHPDFPPELSSVKKQERGFKPRGVWYSMGSAWHDWARVDMPEKVKKTFSVHEVELEHGALKKMAVIQTPSELKTFHDKYSRLAPSGFRDIAWDEVAKGHGGFEIRNYQRIKSALLHSQDHLWMKTFDVDSGCIWDFELVKSIDWRGTVGSFRQRV